jgi:hypothetical protein
VAVIVRGTEPREYLAWTGRRAARARQSSVVTVSVVVSVVVVPVVVVAVVVVPEESSELSFVSLESSLELAVSRERTPPSSCWVATALESSRSDPSEERPLSEISEV